MRKNWIDKVHKSSTFIKGIKDAESIMKTKTDSGGDNVENDDMPFLEYFYIHCNRPKSCLNHFINTLALAGHLMFYFSDSGHITDLHNLVCMGKTKIDDETARKLSFKPKSKVLEDKFWTMALLLSALLHDLGKTLSHERDPFNSVQHANRGYLLYHETMSGRMGKSPAELSDYKAFTTLLNYGGFIKPNDITKLHAVLQSMILYHDRLGVWLTGESGAAPIIELLNSLDNMAEKYDLDYKQIMFTLFVLTLADVMASVPSPESAKSILPYPDPIQPHPLRKKAPGSRWTPVRCSTCMSSDFTNINGSC